MFLWDRPAGGQLMTPQRGWGFADLVRTPRQFALLVAALSVPAAVIAADFYLGYRLRGLPATFVAFLLLQLCQWELWAIAGPLVWSLEARWPLDSPDRRQAIVRHVAAAFIVATAVLFFNLVLYHTLIRMPVVRGWFTGFDRSIAATAIFYFVAYFHVEVLIYGGVVAAAYAARATALLRAKEHDALRLEAELTGARLTALRMQLQPHFLFNTLHTIGSLVLQRENDRAVQLLAELGELLRSTLSHRDTDLAPLADEIAYLRRYLRIEEARFADRLRVEWDLDPAAENALVPPFILQPLVENAFRHGISRRTEDSLLSIAACIEDSSLRITIYNEGPPLAESFSLEEGSGYGLKNVAERLRTRRPAGRLELANVAAAGVRAMLVLPLWDTTSARAAR
jgi:two-component sensor histidine kinase